MDKTRTLTAMTPVVVTTLPAALGHGVNRCKNIPDLAQLRAQAESNHTNNTIQRYQYSSKQAAHLSVE